MNIDESMLPDQAKPLAGTCHHQWQNQQGRYAVSQVCGLCKLYRYKSSATADWEYRAPIPFVHTTTE
jgi:hypothetical protein